MTLYLHELCKGPSRRPEVWILYLTAEDRNGGAALVSWPFDGTEKRRQEVLRFIEMWAREHTITIGNPELWSLERVREERASGTKELV